MVIAWDRRATFLAAGGGLLLVAGIFAAVAAGVAWATADIETSGDFGETSSEIEYRLLEAEFGGEETSYSDDDLDEQDGIGMVRAGGIVFLVGLIVAFVAAVVLGVGIFVRAIPFGLIGTLAGGLAFLVMLVGLILFPLGLDDVHEPSQTDFGGGSVETSELAWGAGLVLAVVAGILALAGPVLALTGLRAPAA